MFRIVAGSTHGLADAEDFIRLIEDLPAHPVASARNLFVREEPIVVARAPGRLDVMGGIADYSGSLVLEMPIREATFTAIQLVSSPRLCIVSLDGDETHRTTSFEMPLTDLARDGEPLTYEDARRYFGRDARTHWAAYVAGCWLVMIRECGLRFDQGANVLIDSAVPEGKSVSSSAALEVATMQALVAALAHTQHLPLRSRHFSPRDLALLCQKVENHVVGAPCGVMDQMTAAAGGADQMMALKCQPAELLEPVPIPNDLAICGIDSGVRHSVEGAEYNSVRVGAFMGFRMIADRAGLPVHRAGQDEPVLIEDTRWGGYLANIQPEEFESQFAHALPEMMTGAAFLDRYGGTTDPATRVDPARTYAVRTPTAHPIYENARVRRFAELMRGPSGADRLESLGALMYESHMSYSACGLGTAATDRLVELVRKHGPARGLYGARITGGGGGGTVAMLVHRDACAAGIETVAKAYMLEGDFVPPRVFSGSSSGAAEFGTLTLLSE